MNKSAQCKKGEVYVGNLPCNISEEDLVKSISFENCEFLRFIRKDVKAFCFVDCGSYENAIKFCQVMNGRELMGRKIVAKVNDRVENGFSNSENKKTDARYNPHSPSSANTAKFSATKNYASPCGQPIIPDDDGPPPLRPIAEYEPVRNDSKLEHASGYCISQHSSNPSKNSKYQTRLADNSYFSSVNLDSCTGSHKFVDQSGHLHDGNRLRHDDSQCIANHHTNRVKAVSYHTEHCYNYDKEYEKNSHFRRYREKSNEIPQFYECVKPDFKHSENNFSKQDIKANRSYSSQRFGTQHNVVQQSYDAHYPQYNGAGTVNQNFSNGCYQQFDKQHHQLQYKFPKANYLSKDDLVSRFRELRFQQANFRKPIQNHTSYAYESKEKHSFDSSETSAHISKGSNLRAFAEENDAEYEPIILSVVNFPFRTTEEMIYKLFEDYDPIEVMMICNYPADVPTEALIVLADEELALNAVMELDNTVYRHRVIFVSDISDDGALEEIQQIV